MTFTRYSDRDLDRFSFHRWDLDLRQYVPFVHGTRTIALRAWLSSADPSDGQRCPSTCNRRLAARIAARLPHVPLPRSSALLLQAEYRWRINELVTGALFYDTGAVAPAPRRFGRLERDYGFGLRVGGRDGVAFRADVAFGSARALASS